MKEEDEDSCNALVWNGILDYSCISLPIPGRDTGGKEALTQVWTKYHY